MNLIPRQHIPASLVLACLLLSPNWLGAAAASDTATHNVTITVTEVAELAIVGADVSFTVGATPPTAGAEPAITATNASAKYLQYTSLVPSAQTRKITVSRSNDLPAGLTLQLQVTLPGANKRGATGSAGAFSAATALTAITGTATQEAVTAIGSGWTGTAGTDGANLTYSLIFTAGDNSFVTSNDPVVVTYTLTTSA
jgi:hypothetical protein